MGRRTALLIIVAVFGWTDYAEAAERIAAFPGAEGFGAQATGGPPAEGNVGAGMGATVGKILGLAGAMKAGLGTASVDLGGGCVVGALVAVNALGDVVDPGSGRILAGARPAKLGPVKVGGAGPFADTMSVE